MGEKDTKLSGEVMERLRDHPKLDTAHMTVVAVNGHVYLKGRADTEEEKELAERIAKDSPGVEAVTNELHVETGFLHALTSIVSSIAANNEEELHHPPVKKEDPDKEKKAE